MQEVIIINNKCYLKKNNNFISTNLKKIFIKDIINKDKIIESKYRNEQLIGYFSTSQTIVFGKTNSNKSFYKITPFIKKLPPFIVANRLALNFLSSKVLKDSAPIAFSLFSQYSINAILEVPDTV